MRATLQSVCERLAAESGLSFEFSLEGTREPFETPADHPIVRAFEAAGRRFTGDAPRESGWHWWEMPI